MRQGIVPGLTSALLAVCSACTSTQHEVLVLGTIHSDHLTSETYGLDVLEAIIRRYEPDVVLTEIPPGRYPEAARQFAEDGTIEEDRVRRFPEYTEVLFPLQAELGFEIVPCAAWTGEMAAARRERIAELEIEFPDQAAEVDAGFQKIEDWVRRERLDTPLGIHSDRYDALVIIGLAPYDAHWNAALGPGGWTNINAAHFDLIARALDEREGQRVLITFGAWHKSWFRSALARRTDVVEVELASILSD